jgi:hypothetical protein
MRDSVSFGEAVRQVCFRYLKGGYGARRVSLPHANNAAAVPTRLEGAMNALCSLALSMVLCCSLAEKAAAQETGSHAIFRKFSDLKWEKTPDGVQDIVILHVNPTSKASELIIRAPKNFHVPRHWHSANETLTIISGTFTVTGLEQWNGDSGCFLGVSS